MQLFEERDDLAGMLRLALLLVLFALPLRAGEVLVAVASNMLPTAQKLAAGFAEATGHEVRLAHGSTGRLYAQIVAGAPFEMFIAADQARPAALEAAGLVRARRVLVEGQLVLVARDADRSLQGARVALADPAVAPYGAAAVQVLDSLGPGLAGVRPVMGDSVGQAASIFATGNADFAFVAAAQLPLIEGFTRIGGDLSARHDPILQDIVWLARADTLPAAELWRWLQGETARAILIGDGYWVRP